MIGDTAAEKAILAGLLSWGNDAYSEISHLLGNGEYFTLLENRDIFQCLQYAFAENPECKPDLFLIQSTAKQIGVSSVLEVDNCSYIQRLFTYSGDRSNLLDFAKKVRKLGVARELQSKLKESAKSLDDVDGSETTLEIITKAEKPLLDYINVLSGQTNEGVQPISDGLLEYLKNKIENPCENLGISSGYPRYDKAIGGGFRRQTVSVIVARMKVGKSFIADNVSWHVAGKLGIPVLYLDTEMNKEGHWPRILANLAKVPIDDIENGQFGQNEAAKAKVRAAYKLLKKAPYHYINVSGNTFDEIISIMRRWVHRTVGLDSKGVRNDCLIIYDYLKMMAADSDKLGKSSETQELGFNATKLSDFTVEYDVPCLTFGQVNRDGIESETSAVIADSDRIARYVTNVSLYKPKTDEEIEADGADYNRKLCVLFTRFGRGLSDKDYINMNFRGEYGEITEGITRNELHRGVSVSRNKGFEEIDEQPIKD